MAKLLGRSLLFFAIKADHVHDPLFPPIFEPYDFMHEEGKPQIVLTLESACTRKSFTDWYKAVTLGDSVQAMCSASVMQQMLSPISVIGTSVPLPAPVTPSSVATTSVTIPCNHHQLCDEIKRYPDLVQMS